MSDDLSTRLARWSQRKLAVERGEAVPAESEDAAAVISSGDEDQMFEPDALVAEEPDTGNDADGTPAADEDGPVLPPIDELNAQSDYTAFMAKGVPEALTRAALRKLWTSDPVLANLDGLNNYDEDYNVVDQIITAAQTSYRPGLGYVDEIEEKVAQLDEKLAKVGGDTAESPLSSDAPAREISTNSAGDIDAPGDGSPDAPRQLVSMEPEKADEDSANDTGEAAKTEEAEDDTGKSLP